jgi:TPR repeat protein
VSLYLELKGCLAGHESSCQEIETPAPRVRPRRLARRAAARCRAGRVEACIVLGHLARLGRGVRRSPRRAAALYRRACDMNRAFGCLALAGLFASGEGVVADPRRAAHLRARACQLEPLACEGGSQGDEASE